ncbi:MAG: response regulator, partial [Nitrospirota bacterium]
LITSCIHMPGMDGFDLLKHVKKSWPDLPFLIITAHGDIEAYLRAVNAGAYDFFVKPISLPDLYRVIARATGLRIAVDDCKSITTEVNAMSNKNKVILVAEDDHSVLMSMCIVFERLGYDAVPAENGLEVLKLLKIIEPDVVMLDLEMPVMGGLETLKQIKRDEQYSQIPVIISTGSAGREVADACHDAGCCCFLAKPVRMAELNEALEKSLFPERGRKHIRTTLNVKVTVVHNGISHSLYTKSISEKGVFIRTKHPFPTGSEVEVVLPVDNEKFLLAGSVIYAADAVDIRHPGMAIEFLNVGDEDSARLRDYVLSLVADGLQT